MALTVSISRDELKQLNKLMSLYDVLVKTVEEDIERLKGHLDAFNNELKKLDDLHSDMFKLLNMKEE